jgi:hypothetical protein
VHSVIMSALTHTHTHTHPKSGPSTHTLWAGTAHAITNAWCVCLHCPAARQSADASTALTACRLSSLLLGGYCEDVRAYAQQDADEDDVYAEVALRAHLQAAHNERRQARLSCCSANGYAVKCSAHLAVDTAQQTYMAYYASQPPGSSLCIACDVASGHMQRSLQTTAYGFATCCICSTTVCGLPV